ncbi:hypothetical protein D3C74_276650 [compost metagenome]
MYAKSSGRLTGSGLSLGPSQSSSSTRLIVGRSVSTVALYTSTAFGLQSVRINRIRSAGIVGSTGTYAPPALMMPYIPAIISTLRSATITTRSSGVICSLRSAHATWLIFRFNSSYVTWLSSYTTAMASGVFATCSSHNAGIVLSLAYGKYVSLNSPNICSFSSSVVVSSSDNFISGLLAKASRTTCKRNKIASISLAP